MINAALSSARTMAVSRQRYVGVRFQKLCTSEDPADPLKGLMDAPQYMIFIMHEEPEQRVRSGQRFPGDGGTGADQAAADHGRHGIELGQRATRTSMSRLELSDATTFSIVFSPSGKLVVHDVRVRNQRWRVSPGQRRRLAPTLSMDDIFNRPTTSCRLESQPAGACSSRTITPGDEGQPDGQLRLRTGGGAQLHELRDL